MIWSVIINTVILLALAWPFGWLAMLLVTVAFSVITPWVVTRWVLCSERLPTP
jgi:hypothetical protein